MNAPLNASSFAVILVRGIAMALMIFAASLILWTMASVLIDILNEADILFWRSVINQSGFCFLLLVFGIVVYGCSIPIARLLTRGLHHQGHCQRCGYNLAAINKTRCPECGHDEPPVASGPPDTP
jgi:hypothetical protein